MCAESKQGMTPTGGREMYSGNLGGNIGRGAANFGGASSEAPNPQALLDPLVTTGDGKGKPGQGSGGGSLVDVSGQDIDGPLPSHSRGPEMRVNAGQDLVDMNHQKVIDTINADIIQKQQMIDSLTRVGDPDRLIPSLNTSIFNSKKLLSGK